MGVTCDSQPIILLEREGHGRSPFSLPSRSCTLCGAIDHSCSRNTLNNSLSNCDHAASHFHCCPGARIVPSLRELDRQNKRALSVFSCFCVQACTLLIYSSCSSLTRGLSVSFQSPQNPPKTRPPPTILFRRYFRCSKSGSWPVC